MLDEIATELPKGVEITHLMSVNDYLYASIHEVIKTLIEAIILVILVVYVFLQDIRSTLIPTISILVSLVGTLLSFVRGLLDQPADLFALVLAIGTVVDDAIIVSKPSRHASTAATSHRTWLRSMPWAASLRPSSPRRWSSWPCLSRCR